MDAQILEQNTSMYMYKCVFRLTTVFVATTTAWEPSSASNWGRHWTQWDYWQEGRKHMKAFFHFAVVSELSISPVYSWIIKYVNRVLLKETVLSEKLDLLSQTSVAS